MTEIENINSMKKNSSNKEEKASQISFPLGGIGTGCIGLAGNGRLIDWEIFNRPNKGSVNSLSHFSVKAEVDGEVIDARVLNGDLQPPYSGDVQTYAHSGFGFGPARATMAGVPHFENVKFKGEYPLANLQFLDNHFPGSVEMTAFNPFIPLNDRDSSIPGAFFDIAIHNTSDKIVSYTINHALANPKKDSKRFNRYSKNDQVQMINLSTDKYDSKHSQFGDLTVATDASEVSYQEYWYRGRWFDNLEVYWRDFTTPGKFNNRTYENEFAEELESDILDLCSLAVHFKLQPGEKKHARFVLTWNFPNYENYWNPVKSASNTHVTREQMLANTWKNYYATIFENANHSAVYSLKNWDRLYRETLMFKETLFSSTLPPVVIDAISANLSTLKSPTCLRLTDGSFYGFEGCAHDAGCCEGSCTHVWNYAYALPFLFPKLERSMRDLDFKHNQLENGKMAFRLQLPVGRKPSNFRACVDGQFGGIIKAYRDWKISGNNEWLKKNWKKIKMSIEFAWAESNEDRWDYDKDGVLEGRQHHTLDMELFGPNAWLNGFYLAALKAGAEMAEFLGELDTSATYMRLFEKGKAWQDEHLFNGEYYQQQIDLKDKSILEKYDENAIVNYWNDEAKEIKYQIGSGCGIDQVSAQWHANLSGLGKIFDQEQTKKSLFSIYQNNFKKSMRNVFNPCRLYSLNDEAGVMICTWPEESKKPIVPLTYAQETMNGFEYQVATHMIQEGMINEGLEIVTAIRDRYDGIKRNPWNELECGSHYARSMASYSLLIAFSGFEYDMAHGYIGFNPMINQDDFNTFWSLDNGWGAFKHHDGQIELNVKSGSLKLKTFHSNLLKDKEIIEVFLGEELVSFHSEQNKIFFEKEIQIQPDQVLKVNLK